MPKKSITSHPTTGEEALAFVEPELELVADTDLVPINVEIPFAVQIALGAVGRIDLLMPQLRELPSLDLRQVTNMRTYALAALQAHLLAVAPRPIDPGLARMLQEGAKLREDLLVSAETLAHFELADGQRVAAIRAGTGYLDMANDLCQLATLFREIWPSAKDRTAVDETMVARAGVLGPALLTALGNKRLVVGDTSGLQRRRERAFTLFVRAYDQCRRGVGFVRWGTGDADQFTPSLYIRRRRRTNADTPHETADEERLSIPVDVESTPIETPTLLDSNPI